MIKWHERLAWNIGTAIKDWAELNGVRWLVGVGYRIRSK
jgi:hypothetical protein